MTDRPNPHDWLIEHGSIVGYPGPDGCPYVAHDCEVWRSIHMRLAELGVMAVKASPDVIHMLLGREWHATAEEPEDTYHGCLQASALGYTMTCDKTLPPRSVIGVG